MIKLFQFFPAHFLRDDVNGMEYFKIAGAFDKAIIIFVKAKINRKVLVYIFPFFFIPLRQQIIIQLLVA